jgi:hypothetical protein
MNNEEYKKDLIAKKLIQIGGLEVTSSEFSDNVMARIRKEAHTKIHAIEPILSKKVWYMIALAVIFILFFTIISIPQGEVSRPETLCLKNNIMPYINTFFDSLTKFVSGINISPIIPTLLVSILLIEIFDITLRRLIKIPKKF